MRARLASANPHKLVELRRALPGWEIELVDDRDFPPETGSTYEENARGKALHGRRERAGGRLGDRRGLGDRGVRARREAGACLGPLGRSTASRSCSTELAPLEDRRARYVCVIVAIGPAGEEIVAEGTLAGTIAPDRRGAEGFGYDPIFVPDGRDEHRGRARRRLEDGQFAPRAGRCGVGGRAGNPGRG